MKPFHQVIAPIWVSCALFASVVGGSTIVRASPSSDAMLQQTAEKLLPKVDRVASTFPGPMSDLDSKTNTYIRSLKRVLETYTLRHPDSGIRAAATLFVPPHGGYLLTTNTSAHMDWQSSDFVYGPSKVTTLTQSFSNKLETYQIYNVAISIPTSYRTSHFRGSLVVYTVTKQR